MAYGPVYPRANRPGTARAKKSPPGRARAGQPYGLDPAGFGPTGWPGGLNKNIYFSKKV